MQHRHDCRDTVRDQLVSRPMGSPGKKMIIAETRMAALKMRNVDGFGRYFRSRLGWECDVRISRWKSPEEVPWLGSWHIYGIRLTLYLSSDISIRSVTMT